MLDIEPLSNMWSPELEGAGCALYASPNKERFWIDGWVADKVAHITLLYGLMESGETHKYHAKRLLKNAVPDFVEIDHVGMFESPYPEERYACVVAHIVPKDELVEAHNRLEMLPHVNTFVGYKPHMTLGYFRYETEDAKKWVAQFIKESNKMWAGKTMKTKELNFGGN